MALGQNNERGTCKFSTSNCIVVVYCSCLHYVSQSVKTRHYDSLIADCEVE